MIFMRQKPYGQSRSRSRHRTQRNNRQPIQLTISRLNNLNNENALSRRRPQNQSSSSIDFIRSITLNERLASIGGLFGALSIIITGALLYAIFTAKSQDKMYYIIAVLVNISILVVLMIAAILFDRLYLKKYANRTQTARTRNGRIININPSLYNNLSSQPGLLSNLNNLLNQTETQTNSLDYVNIRSYNDIPPEYPGYLEQPENDNTTLPINQSPNPNKISNQISTISSEIPSHVITSINNQHSQLSTYLTDPIIVSNFNFVNPILNDTTHVEPPKYYELYPNNSEANTQSPEEHNTTEQNRNNETVIQIGER